MSEAGLRVKHDEDPPRHANIIGWPADVPERKQRQQLLARCSCPVKLSSPIQVKENAEGISDFCWTIEHFPEVGGYVPGGIGNAEGVVAGVVAFDGLAGEADAGETFGGR